MPSNPPNTSRRSFVDRFRNHKATPIYAETDSIGNGRLRNLLSKAGQNFRTMLSGADDHHQQLIDDIETLLLQADVGIVTTKTFSQG